MRIGIIGAGDVGSTLAQHFIEAGNDVAIANSRDPDTLDPLIDRLNGVATVRRAQAATAADAASFGDVVVLAVPFGAYAQIPAAECVGKTIIDATNYYPQRDGHIAEIDDGSVTSSEMIADRLRGAHVVKAFNAMTAEHLRDYARHGGTMDRYGIPVSGDDNDAKRTVLDLVNDSGFDPVDAGPLATGGRKHQPGSTAYLADVGGRKLGELLSA